MLEYAGLYFLSSGKDIWLLFFNDVYSLKIGLQSHLPLDHSFQQEYAQPYANNNILASENNSEINRAFAFDSFYDTIIGKENPIATYSIAESVLQKRVATIILTQGMTEKQVNWNVNSSELG